MLQGKHVLSPTAAAQVVLLASGGTTPMGHLASVIAILKRSGKTQSIVLYLDRFS